MYQYWSSLSRTRSNQIFRMVRILAHTKFFQQYFCSKLLMPSRILIDGVREMQQCGLKFWCIRTLLKIAFTVTMLKRSKSEFGANLPHMHIRQLLHYASLFNVLILQPSLGINFPTYIGSAPFNHFVTFDTQDSRRPRGHHATTLVVATLPEPAHPIEDVGNSFTNNPELPGPSNIDNV